MKDVFSHAMGRLMLWFVIGVGTPLWAVETARAPSLEDSTSYWATSSPLKAYVGPGLALYRSSTGWALNTGVLARVTSDLPTLFVGADLGLNFWSYSSNVAGASAGATGIQLLPTAIYGFGISSLPSVHPYVGLSLGPNIFVDKVTVAGVSDTDTRVFFELLFRLGANFNVSKGFTLNVEPKLGLLRSDFIFLPQVNGVFAL